MRAFCNYIVLCVVYQCCRPESGDKIFQLICLLHSSLKLALQASLPALLDSPRNHRSYRQSPCTVLGPRTQGSRSVAVHHERGRIKKALWSYMLCYHWAAFPSSSDTANMLGIGRSTFFLLKGFLSFPAKWWWWGSRSPPFPACFCQGASWRFC